ncbi:MAG TPA: hypothetical protein VGP70_14210 [Actinomadura sp.]|jgi:hypothetical protein|nr:hypothetical protein [Actinomadura sp.]
MTTTEAKAGAAAAESGEPARSKDAGPAGTDLIDQLVAHLHTLPDAHDTAVAAFARTRTGTRRAVAS